jgi:hypothetical protein
MMQGESFDVFLCHNSADKPAVLQLAEELESRGLRVWLDAWELIPGRPWQEALEKILQTAKSAAVLVAKDGVGPWQRQEVRACLEEFVRRALPVIPVLLPGAARELELPFLRSFTWVDLSDGITREGVDRLVWGITGERERVTDMALPSRGWLSFLDRLAASIQTGALYDSQLARLLLVTCKQSPGCAVREDFQFRTLEIAVKEADHLVLDADRFAGSPEARRFGLQAATRMTVAVAGALDRSRRAQELIVTCCEGVLELDEIRLRLEWPMVGRGRLYTLAVETADPHDQDVYDFLDEHAQDMAR